LPKHLIRRGVWPWILGVALLVLVGWALFEVVGRSDSGVRVQETTTGAG
jgi:hypothetical protein